LRAGLIDGERRRAALDAEVLTGLTEARAGDADPGAGLGERRRVRRALQVVRRLCGIDLRPRAVERRAGLTFVDRGVGAFQHREDLTLADAIAVPDAQGDHAALHLRREIALGRLDGPRRGDGRR